jgi:Peptidase inhibitor I9
VNSLTKDLATEADAKVKHKYSAALNGFAATMSKADAQQLAADPAVAYVAQNQTLHAFSD